MVTIVDGRLPTRMLPSRSRISPRSGCRGTNRTWFWSARLANSSVANTWRNHSLVVNAANMKTASPAKTLIRVRVFDSVTRCCSLERWNLPPEHLCGPRGFGDPADHRKKKRREHGVVHAFEEGHLDHVARPHRELAQQERDELVEQDCSRGGRPDDQHGQDGTGRHHVLPDRPHCVSDEGERQRGDPLWLIQQEVLCHPPEKPRHGSGGGPFQERQDDCDQVHQVRLGIRQLHLREYGGRQHQRSQDDSRPRKDSSHRPSLTSRPSQLRPWTPSHLLLDAPPPPDRRPARGSAAASLPSLLLPPWTPSHLLLDAPPPPDRRRARGSAAASLRSLLLPPLDPLTQSPRGRTPGLRSRPSASARS